MKTVVITGSARGLGYAMAENFRKANCNLVLSDLKNENLQEAKEKLEKIDSEGKILTAICNVSKYDEIENLMKETLNAFERVYNILGDRPETVAEFFVDNILKNKKNGIKINWLTNRKAFYRFLTAGFNKRNFFDDNGEIKQCDIINKK